MNLQTSDLTPAERRAERRKTAKEQQNLIRLKSTKAALAAARKLLLADVGRRSISAVAKDLDLCWGTVANIVDQITEYPRFETLLRVYTHYGLSIALEDK